MKDKTQLIDKLVRHVVDAWDQNALVEYAHDQLTEYYNAMAEEHLQQELIEADIIEDIEEIDGNC